MKIPRLIENYKHVYGTYSAMALMNIQTVLNHIQKIVGIEEQSETKSEDYWEHPVVQLLNNVPKKSPEKAEAVTEKLLHSFPFLKIMADNQREHSNKINSEKRLEINSNDIYSVLNTILHTLKKYRDYTCHYYIKDNAWDDGSLFLNHESRLSIIINKYYDVALRNVKERYNYNTQALAFIQDHRYKKSIGVNNRKITVTDYSFFLSMQSENEDRNHKPHLSGVGVAQLIALFIEKKYINEFIAKIHICGKYSAKSEEYKIIRRSMSINSIVLPKERIKSDKKGMAVAMDMLNELKRCPRELFETLSFSDQCRFRIISSDYNEVLQMRSTDRFVQLALQYIDYNRLFNNIRFHVNMGKLRYLFSPDKRCIDGQERVRVIEHPLNGYGRIDEMEKYRKNENGNYGNSNIHIRDFENVKRDDSDRNNYPYVVDTYTHYLLNNNKIEFCFCNDKITPKIESEAGKWYAVKEKPACRMSTFELPAMMFHLLLLGSERTEQRIAEVYNKYIKLFSALCEGTLTKENIDNFGIARADIPQKVLDSINNVTKGKSYKAHIKKTLITLLDETKKLLNRIKEDKRAVLSKDNKMGKRGFKQISAGKLAAFLSDDIVKFQPSLLDGDLYGTDRITGMNFRVMQAAIATFNSYTDASALDDLKSIFTNASLIGGKKERNHPFLYFALSKNPRDTIELYEKYLLARKGYIERLITNNEKGEKIVLPFVNIDNNKWQRRDEDFYKTMGEIYLQDVAIELPRQMFDEEIKSSLRKLPQMQDINFETSNVTYLIAEYTKRVLCDDFQEFYSWKRNYRYIDLLKCETDKKGSLCKQYTSTTERETLWQEHHALTTAYINWAQKQRNNNPALKQLSDKEFDEILQKRLSASRNDYQRDEKTIRRYKIQDALLFMIVNNTLTRYLDFESTDFKLKDIMPDTERGILSEIVPMDFLFEKNGKKYVIHSNGIKLKNYGDFFTLANDKRFVPLLNILSTDTVDKDEISTELDNYDTCRPNIVKLILDFEKLYLTKFPEIKNIANYKHLDFKAILDELISRGILNDNDKDVLRKIRNAFNHNVYPENNILKIRTLPEIARHLIDIFGEHAHIVE